MPSILRYILISEILKYGKLCSLELMKYDSCLIAFAHPSPHLGLTHHSDLFFNPELSTIRAPPFQHSGKGSRWTCDHLLIHSLSSKSHYFSIFRIELYLTPISTGLELINDLLVGGSGMPPS